MPAEILLRSGAPVTGVGAAGVLEGKRVLDLGSGTGNLTERIVRAGGEAWALDFSEKML